MMLFSALTTWLFSVPRTTRRWYDVIIWWEVRRAAYNGILLMAGILSIIGFLAFFALPPTGFVSEPDTSANDLGDPGLGIIALIIFALAANICYTLGWIVELPIFWSDGDRPSVAPALLKTGLLFSVLVVFIPTFGSCVYWIYRIFK
jgi:hypothetical protein